MGWNDRDYGAGREEMKAYLSNPLALTQFALPIYRGPQLQIRLSFWFLMAALFLGIDDLRARTPLYYIPADMVLLLVLVLWHELGHRVFSRTVGGTHWEWVLWPLGGLVPPTVPRQPWPTFVGAIGGVVFSAAALAALYFGLEPLVNFLARHNGASIGVLSLLGHESAIGVLLSFYIVLINFFPCYWFDGGFIWQSILWPKLGLWKAIRITCLAGMILAVPLFVWSLWATSLLGMVMWAMVFADCFRRRQMLAAAGPGVVDDDDAGPAYNYMDAPEPRRHKKANKRWFSKARKRATQDQAEQAKIDAILAKVKEKGLHSLTWWEKRTLRKATERQRQQDLAERR